jgi:YD repeat-containing protein
LKTITGPYLATLSFVPISTIMKKTGFLLLLLCFQYSLFSQYYYKDLLTTSQTNQTYKLLTGQSVKKVSLTSFDGNSSETAGFSCEQDVDVRKRTIVTTTKTSVVGDSYLITSYNEKGQLIKTTDSAQNASNNSLYEYNAAGQVSTITTSSSSDNITTTESHTWTYDAGGHPISMLRIRNNFDTTKVNFTLDEKGNVAEEKVSRKNQPVNTVYYYFDAQNRLTDIVRYNEKAKRLLPDYMFEYNEQAQLKKMVIIPEGSNDYQNWYYQYLPNGLKRMDLCYNKAQQLLGKVEYNYDF